MSIGMGSDRETDLEGSAAAPADIVSQLWREILGDNADPAHGFLENGGDSFGAMVLATRVFETTGVELDYLDVLEIGGADDLVRQVAARGTANT